jgi:mono/diheme cytochrome c family protein
MWSRRCAVLVAFSALLVLWGCARHSDTARDTTNDAAPMPSDSSENRGAELFARNCAACHGARGAAGPVGPSLAGERRRKTFDQVVRIVERPDPPMPKLFPGTLGAQDVADIAAYVESL